VVGFAVGLDDGPPLLLLPQAANDTTRAAVEIAMESLRIFRT
jgi:hypothetical protein